MLAVCHQPIPQSALDRSERFAGSPLDELRTVGLVNRSELGWTMLSQAQVRWLTLRPREALTEARHNALRCLEGLDDPGILTDRLRLLLASGEADAAIELLKERAETLWLRGWAPELWRALRTSELTGLWPWRLSAATHLGKVEEVAALIKQGPPEELANDTLTLAR